MQEEWRPVPGHETHYEVSNLGRVRRACSGVATQAGRLLKPQLRGGSGLRETRYPGVSLFRGGKKTNWQIHALVLAAFVGPCPEGHCGNHIDGNRQNSRLDNLEYVTFSQNNVHAFTVLGRIGKRGSTNHLAKLTEADVATIHALRRGGMLQKDIAARFSVRQSAISRVLSGVRWGHFAPA